jgi:hypothetical protein
VSSASKVLKANAAFVLLSLAVTRTVVPQQSSREAPSTHVVTVETGVDLRLVDWGGRGDPLLFSPSWASTSQICALPADGSTI